MINKIKIFNNILWHHKITTQFAKCLSTEAAVKLEKESEIEMINKKIKSEWDGAKPFEKIPGPSTFELIRWFLPGGKLYKKPLNNLHKMLYEELGSVSKLPGLFGKQDLIVTFNPDDFEKVFRTEGIWPNRPGLESITHYRKEIRKDVYEGAGGLVSSFGEDWGKFRRIANPVLMQPRNIKKYISDMNITTSEFIEKIRLIRDPSTLEAPDDFNDHVTNWTLELICSVALDKKFDLIKNPTKNPDALKMKKEIQLFFELLFKLDFKPSIWKIAPTPNYRKFIKSMDILTDITKKYTEETYTKLQIDKKSDQSNEGSVLEQLCKIDKKFGIIMAMDLLIAGVDTTSSAFIATLTCLSKNPDKQEILRNEIIKILPETNSPMTNENMSNLPYLRACIKEGLRVHPVTNGNVRVTQQDLVLGGYQIPKNSQVFMPLTIVSQNDSHFSDSSKYIPERWLRTAISDECPYSGGKGKSTNPFAYLPFGFGPRMCIGKRLVDLELEIGIAKIIRNFQIEFNYPDENLFEMKAFNVPNIPLKYKFIDL